MRRLLSLAVLAAVAALPAAAQSPRSVAVTIDDLPLNAGPPSLRCDADGLTAMHGELLGHLAAHEAPAVAFVNAGRVCDSLPAGFLETTLTRWLDGGHALGNHTATHPDITNVSVAAYGADVLAGEPLLRRLLDARGDLVGRRLLLQELDLGGAPQDLLALGVRGRVPASGQHREQDAGQRADDTPRRPPSPRGSARRPRTSRDCACGAVRHERARAGGATWCGGGHPGGHDASPTAPAQSENLPDSGRLYRCC
ncbi:MAG TPA: polysaccharide deacetylase family protein [Rhodothermales bacterium]|nr:polysaccharide deacetylase family protein [Rhodothermales bacterium]